MKGNRKTPHYRRFRTVAQLIVATLVMVVVVILRKREKYRIDSLLGSSLYERRGEYTPTIETEEKLRHDEDLRSDGGGRIINTQHSNAVHEETAKNERSDSNEAKETELNSPRVVEEHNASQGSRLSQPKGTMPIQELSVIGERNSGTRWTVTHLSECFNHTLLVREKLVRHKHWFQHDVPNGRNRVGTFVVAQFRNPYHWTEAMRKVPHHSPKHYRKDWKSFITTPWTMERLASDLDILKQNMTLGLTADKIACQEYFNYNQIISCSLRPYPPGYFKSKPPYSGHQPQYELRNDGSGLAYGSILDLRADKIKNHLSLAEWNWVQDLYAVQYEELLTKGTASMVRYIEKVTGVKAHCDPIGPQDRPQRSLSREYMTWMTGFVNWDAEGLVGYKPWDEKQIEIIATAQE